MSLLDKVLSWLEPLQLVDDAVAALLAPDLAPELLRNLPKYLPGGEAPEWLLEKAVARVTGSELAPLAAGFLSFWLPGPGEARAFRVFREGRSGVRWLADDTEKVAYKIPPGIGSASVEFLPLKYRDRVLPETPGPPPENYKRVDDTQLINVGTAFPDREVALYPHLVLYVPPVHREGPYLNIYTKLQDFVAAVPEDLTEHAETPLGFAKLLEKDVGYTVQALIPRAVRSSTLQYSARALLEFYKGPRTDDLKELFVGESGWGFPTRRSGENLWRTVESAISKQREAIHRVLTTYGAEGIVTSGFMRAYTGPAYIGINAAMREAARDPGKWPEVPKIIAHPAFRNLFIKLPTELELVRYTFSRPTFQMVRPGVRFADGGLSSYSYNPNFGWEGNVVIRVRPNGAYGYVAEAVRRSTIDEAEVVLFPATPVRVLEMGSDPEYQRISGEALPRFTPYEVLLALGTLYAGLKEVSDELVGGPGRGDEATSGR